MTIAIIGAGLAGLACAERLEKAGHAVTLFDKGRRPGGRMATRRIATVAGDARFDHGAQYFTARDVAFQARVASWRREGLVAPWPAAGAHALVGTPGMSAPVGAMARGLDVRSTLRVGTLERIDAGWRLHGDGIGAEIYESVVVAVPAEQVEALVGPFDAAMAARAMTTVSAPCWTIMAAFAARVPVEADVIKQRGPIGWAARDNAKPDRSGPESWVIQGSPDWSRAHLEDDPAAATRAILDAFDTAVEAKVPAPLVATAHRWRYAMCGQHAKATPGPSWNAALKLGVCGDWTIGPRIEAAWLSGDRLAGLVLGN